MPQRHITIVGYGDSITLAREQPEDKKWLNVLAGALAGRFPNVRWTMVNAGVGGNTSREGLARFETDITPHQPDVALIEFGGNDATHDAARHVPLSEYEANLRIIVEGLRKIRTRPVLLTFPPIIDDWHCFGKEPFYTRWDGPDRCIEEYRGVTRRFAGSENIPLADVDAAMRRAFEKDGAGAFVLPDGVHLTELGNRVVAETVLATLAAQSNWFV